MQNLPAGWTIPIGTSSSHRRISIFYVEPEADFLAVLFVLSFPPLFGQEVSRLALA